LEAPIFLVEVDCKQGVKIFFDWNKTIDMVDFLLSPKGATSLLGGCILVNGDLPCLLSPANNFYRIFEPRFRRTGQL